MELDKLPIISNTEANRASNRHRHSEVRKPGIINVKERDTKFNLNDSGKIDEIYLCLSTLR